MISKRTGIILSIATLAVGTLAAAVPASASVPNPVTGPSAPLPAGCQVWQSWQVAAKRGVTTRSHWYRVLLCDVHKSTERLVLQQTPIASSGGFRVQ